MPFQSQLDGSAPNTPEIKPQQPKKCPYISSFVATQNPTTGWQDVKPAVGFCITDACTFWMGDKKEGTCLLALGFQTLIYASSSIADSFQNMVPQQDEEDDPSQKPENIPTIEELNKEQEPKNEQ